MARKPCPANPPCPRCGAAHVVKNGSKGGQRRWVCRNCKRSFGPTLGTAMYRLRNTPTEVGAHGCVPLRVVMRRGSLSAAEEITGHKYETIGRWLRAAARQAEQITNALVHELHLTAVEVDAFWSFVKKAWSTWRPSQRADRDEPALRMHKGRVPNPPYGGRTPRTGSAHALRGGLGLCCFGTRTGSKEPVRVPRRMRRLPVW